MERPWSAMDMAESSGYWQWSICNSLQSEKKRRKIDGIPYDMKYLHPFMELGPSSRDDSESEESEQWVYLGSTLPGNSSHDASSSDTDDLQVIIYLNAKFMSFSFRGVPDRRGLHPVVFVEIRGECSKELSHISKRVSGRYFLSRKTKWMSLGLEMRVTVYCVEKKKITIFSSAFLISHCWLAKEPADQCMGLANINSWESKVGVRL